MFYMQDTIAKLMGEHYDADFVIALLQLGILFVTQ